ncbi:hypothetical protein, unlikely [Trypanosoma brucei brucei TREU927]|uniref:Uncharacterized protein n=1 Tax=Trypanosoma brucei brucei (strain 927/4 GUTat10.1) TaxID=185431 RepID=Q38F00_TRYB2|nr:hypothetical protein, unlikely [Trypanosoma brucei brucei TREU927]EAN76620.1 hypothetical protein, unlikely [Trypanosoma brucei brucei TREU927]
MNSNTEEPKRPSNHHYLAKPQKHAKLNKKKSKVK